MRHNSLLVSFLASALFAAGVAQAEPVTYKLDPNHTIVLAQWDHFGFSHPVAHFGQVDGTLVYDADNVAASRVAVVLPLAGLESFVPEFNKHLRSADFFDAAKWPTATFTSTKVEKVSDKKLKVTGDLTLRDVTKSVVLDVTLNKAGEGRNGEPKIGFDATTTIQRSAFGIGKYVPNVSDDVQIRITTEALGTKAADAAQ
jgi:polyisoprenoid-binding protein YceI